MRNLKVWMRVGDQDDYHAFDSVDEAAEELHYLLHATTDERWEHGDGPCPTGGHEVRRYQGPALTGVEVIGSGLEGDNGVSLFWGGDDAQKYAELSESELRHFGSYLA